MGPSGSAGWSRFSRSVRSFWASCSSVARARAVLVEALVSERSATSALSSSPAPSTDSVPSSPMPVSSDLVSSSTSASSDSSWTRPRRQSRTDPRVFAVWWTRRVSDWWRYCLPRSNGVRASVDLGRARGFRAPGARGEHGVVSRRGQAAWQVGSNGAGNRCARLRPSQSPRPGAPPRLLQSRRRLSLIREERERERPRPGRPAPAVPAR